MRFGKKPCIYHILKEESELGGCTWTLANDEFDRLFLNDKIFQYKDKIWGILEFGNNECIKVYRENSDGM